MTLHRHDRTIAPRRRLKAKRRYDTRKNHQNHVSGENSGQIRQKCGTATRNPAKQREVLHKIRKNVKKHAKKPGKTWEMTETVGKIDKKDKAWYNDKHNDRRENSGLII